MALSRNNWDVSYSSICFFEKVLRGHGRVRSFRRRDDIVFEIELENGEEIKVLLVNEYILGLAAILKGKEEFPDVEYIVTCADWNGYTPQAKEYGQKNNLGIFVLGEFLGALNWTEPKKYYKKDSDGNAVYHYKTS
jgi:hypothetical protein